MPRREVAKMRGYEKFDAARAVLFAPLRLCVKLQMESVNANPPVLRAGTQNTPTAAVPNMAPTQGQELLVASADPAGLSWL